MKTFEVVLKDVRNFSSRLGISEGKIEAFSLNEIKGNTSYAKWVGEQSTQINHYNSFEKNIPNIAKK